MPAVKRTHMLTNKPFNAGGMLYVTKQLIDRKKARGYSKTIKDPTGGKDWMHPEVRKVLEYMLKRNVFDVSFDSRKRYEDFFSKAIKITAENKQDWLIHEELKLHVGKYVFLLAAKEARASKKPLDVSAAAETLRHAIKRSLDRAEKIVPETQRIRSKKAHSAVSGEKLRHENYYRLNARDAFAHVGAEYTLFEMDGHTILKAAEEVAADLRRHR